MTQLKAFALRLSFVHLLIPGLLVCILISLGASAGPAQASTRTCVINWGSFSTAKATKVKCSTARRTIKAWWKKGGQTSPCYTAKGCRVGAFRCGVRWVGYTGNGKCTASRHRKIVFVFAE